MRLKVERIANSISEVIRSWPGIEAVVLCETSENDIFDPYFVLGIDAYYSSSIPSAEQRCSSFSDPGAFESSTVQLKDRFFIEALPVHIDYKQCSSIETLLSASGDSLGQLLGMGTYVLYRLKHGIDMFKRSPWIDQMRQKASSFPDEAWNGLRQAFQTRMEHFLSDLGAAALKDDAFFYTLSIAGFLRSAGQALFVINKVYEPSARNFTSCLLSLPTLPEGFRGKWGSMLQAEVASNRRKMFEIAQHVALSIIHL